MNACWRRGGRAIIGLVIAGLLASSVVERALAVDEKTAVAIILSPDGGQSADNAADTGQKIVFANTKTFLQGWTEYNTGDCTLIDHGSTTATTAPKYGKLTFAIESLHLNTGDHCNGTVLSFSVAYYTWTDTNSANSADLLSLQWKSKDYQTDRDWTILLGPRIFMGAKDVTNTTQKVAIGQRIALTTQPTKAGQTQSWTVAGKTVGGFSATPTSSATGKVLPTDFTQSSTTFFWTTTGTKNVNYTVTVGGKTGTAKAKFEAQGPTGGPTDTLGTVQIIQNNTLGFGNITTAKAPGIIVTENATASPKPGKFVWVQLVDFDSFIYFIGATRKTCSFGKGLDNSFPYDTGATTNDSPNTGLENTWTQASQSNHFRMFLMWQSSTSKSIPVPLGYVDWKWSGAASYNMTTKKWKLDTGTKSANIVIGSAFPLWTNVLTNGTRTCK